MINQQLVDFIKGQLKNNISREVISKELLANSWTMQDIEEAYKAIGNIPTPIPQAPNSTLIQPQPQFSNTILTSNATPVSNINSYNPNINNSDVVIKEKKHSGGKIFLIVIILLLLAGGASAYYFKNEIMKLPILKDIFPTKEVVLPEVPVPPTPEINQEQNLPAQTPTEVAQTISEIKDCGNDLNCFISTANSCQKSKVTITTKGLKAFNVGTIDVTSDYSIEGKDKNNCIAKIKISDYKLTYSADTVAKLLKGGKTQLDINNEKNDSSKMMIGTGQVCKLDSNKKMGDALNQNIIANPFQTGADCIDSTCSYTSGLICEQFGQLSDNSSCNLKISMMGIDTVNQFKMGKGMNFNITALGFTGLENKVSWVIKDTNIATVLPASGNKVIINSKNIGTTQLTVTDNSVSNCSLSVPVTVISGLVN